MQKFKTTCVWAETHYKSFGVHPNFAELYGVKESEIVEIELEIHEDQTPDSDNTGKVMEADYWGWFDKDRQKFTLIWPKYFLLNMCFPSGIKGAEGANQGKAYRLKISQ